MHMLGAGQAEEGAPTTSFPVQTLRRGYGLAFPIWELGMMGTHRMRGRGQAHRSTAGGQCGAQVPMVKPQKSEAATASHPGHPRGWRGSLGVRLAGGAGVPAFPPPAKFRVTP